MNRSPRKIFCAFLLLTILVPSIQAKDKAETFKAVQPEVQTAQWAQRWWKPRHEQKLAEKKKMEKVNLLMIGDSITHSWEGPGKAVWSKHYARRNALNLGFSGDRTEQVIWRIQNGEVDDIQPKLAVIMIGTNNTGHRMDPAEQTAAGIKIIIQELQKRLPETKILLLAIFPRGEKPDDKMRVRNEEINKIITGYADDKKVFFLDINDKFLDENGILTKEMMPDRLHPKQKGYGIWADAMEPAIKKLMGE